MDEAHIEVHGIPDLQKGLRLVDKDLPKELRAGLNDAAQIVLDAARPLVPRKSGAAQDSMKLGSTQRTAAIKVGGTAAPYFPWLDFGGSTGRGHVERQGDSGAIKRKFIKGGRFIYPALKRKRDAVVAKVDEVLERLARKAGFETHGR